MLVKMITISEWDSSVRTSVYGMSPAFFNSSLINVSMPTQNSRHCAGGIFQSIFREWELVYFYSNLIHT